MQFFVQHLWWIIIGGVLLIGLGTWWVMLSGVFPRFLDMINPNRDKKIPVKLFCEDNQIRDRKLTVGRYVISDDKNHHSYYLVHDLFATAVATGRQFLALNVRDSIPVDFLGGLTKEKRDKLPSSQRVFLDTTADIRSDASRESSKNMAMMSLSIITMAGALIVIVFAIIMFWQSRSTGVTP